VTVRVLLFGHYKDRLTAGGALVLDDLADGSTVTDVAERLAARDARLSSLLQRTRVAVGGDFAAPDAPLRDGDEVAFLPPMSGG
jgi:molybdopterin converting factor small subunit